MQIRLEDDAGENFLRGGFSGPKNRIYRSKIKQQWEINNKKAGEKEDRDVYKSELSELRWVVFFETPREMCICVYNKILFMCFFFTDIYLKSFRPS